MSPLSQMEQPIKLWSCIMLGRESVCCASNICKLPFLCIHTCVPRQKKTAGLRHSGTITAALMIFYIIHTDWCQIPHQAWATPPLDGLPPQLAGIAPHQAWAQPTTRLCRLTQLKDHCPHHGSHGFRENNHGLHVIKRAYEALSLFLFRIIWWDGFPQIFI